MEMQRHQVNGTALEKSIGQRQDRTADAGLFRAAQSVMTCVSPASNAGGMVLPDRVSVTMVVILRDFYTVF